MTCFNFKRKTENIVKNGGYTFIELLVAMALVISIITVTLVSYRDFEAKLLVGNLAHEVALSIREAQVYGLNVRGNEGDFNTGYGIHFEKGAGLPISSFTLFADNNIDHIYNLGDDTAIEVYNFGTGFVISDVCAVTTDMMSITECFSDAATITKLNIAFKRPDPDAIFTTDFVPTKTYEKVEITIESLSRGDSKKVVVYPTGFISVE